MFGESESESPRLPSPWDSLISVPPSPLSPPDQRNIPQLVPEAEEVSVIHLIVLSFINKKLVNFVIRGMLNTSSSFFVPPQPVSPVW
jgi:hypothetical protein